MNKIDHQLISDFFKMFSDESRMKIILTLTEKEYSVLDLAEKVSMSQTAVSYQLRILRGAKIVKFRKEAPQVFYSIDDDHISQLIKLAAEHLNEKEKDL